MHYHNPSKDTLSPAQHCVYNGQSLDTALWHRYATLKQHAPAGSLHHDARPSLVWHREQRRAPRSHPDHPPPTHPGGGENWDLRSAYWRSAS